MTMLDHSSFAIHVASVLVLYIVAEEELAQRVTLASALYISSIPQLQGTTSRKRHSMEHSPAISVLLFSLRLCRATSL
jgi:hypothetical protein